MRMRDSKKKKINRGWGDGVVVVGGGVRANFELQIGLLPLHMKKQFTFLILT